MTIDLEYTWILLQGKNCRQCKMLLLSMLFIGQFVYPVGGKGME